MLTTDRAVLIRYERDGQPRHGSGLRVAGRFVLTADHCANGTGHVVVTNGREYDAQVFVRGSAAVDVAVLEAPSLPMVDPVGCAVLDRGVPREVPGCWALGFPVWKDRGRALAQVPGNVPTAEGVDPAAQPHRSRRRSGRHRPGRDSRVLAAHVGRLSAVATAVR